MHPRIIRYADPEPRYGLLHPDHSIQPLAGSPYSSLETAGPATHIERVRLLAPVRPGSVYGAGLNYVGHAREMGLETPAYPMMFMKPASAVIGPEAQIIYPREAENLHFEAEVAVIIGKAGRRIPEARALEYVLGFTCGNDVSERTIQAKEMKQGCLVLGKAFDTFNPLGPSIAVGIEAGNIDIIARVNGIERQRSNTSDLVYSVRALIAHLSSGITLQPGDVIMTGTPAGVGPILSGDIVEIEIPQAGILRNPVVAEVA